MTAILTSSTVATLSSARAATGGADDLGLVVILTFLLLVVQKEVVSPAGILFGSGGGVRLNRALNVGIVPLGLATLMITVIRVAQMF
ncbi:MAG TPA: hypothetical protein VHS99_07170 [Chloroflexota bacterium]|jgi:hypothetical protein|nr:hypothetical protein [Chloroflexota bacterium]